MRIEVIQGDKHRAGVGKKSGNPYCTQQVWCEGVEVRPVPVNIYVGETEAELIPPGVYDFDVERSLEVRDGDLTIRLRKEDLVEVES